MEMQLASEINLHLKFPSKAAGSTWNQLTKWKDRQRVSPCQTTEQQQQGVSYFQ
jgi:hypothetical protein